jgi:hypothetical protein
MELLISAQVIQKWDEFVKKRKYDSRERDIIQSCLRPEQTQTLKIFI